jgi:dimethylhistidine N-methyltransferase
LKNSIDKILKIIGDEEISLVELGNGNSSKTRILLGPMLTRLNKVSYFPIDVSLKMLRKSIANLFREYTNLEIYGVCSDYVTGLVKINEFVKFKKNIPKKKFIIFLGSSIGNFDPIEALTFLRSIVRYVKKNDLLLIGIDLEKDKSILDKAYNDKNGVTAKFNLNVLSRINEELDGEFNLSNFEHKSFYNANKHRIEMHLISKTDHYVSIGAIGKKFHFRKGESIHTENSYKYSIGRFNKLARISGLQIVKNFADTNEQYSLLLLKKIPNTTKA